MKENQRGLSFSDINTDWKLALDADNVFWGLVPKMTMVTSCCRKT